MSSAKPLSDLDEIRSLLHKIQTSYAHVRKEYIAALQNKIWDESVEINEAFQDILNDLAGDLNFYEPDARYRDEGYYDDKRLSEIIQATLEKIEEVK